MTFRSLGKEGEKANNKWQMTLNRPTYVPKSDNPWPIYLPKYLTSYMNAPKMIVYSNSSNPQSSMRRQTENSIGQTKAFKIVNR